MSVRDSRGGSRISPGGRQLPGEGVPIYNFAKFSQKLHEIERIWVPRAGARAPAPPKSATGLIQSCLTDFSLIQLVHQMVRTISQTRSIVHVTLFEKFYVFGDSKLHKRLIVSVTVFCK